MANVPQGNIFLLPFPFFIVINSFNLKVDAVQVEINPFVETPQGQVVSVDAKIGFDDNAKFRQKEIFEMEDTTESDPREVEANKYNLNYIGMDGNIGCLGKSARFFKIKI